MAASRSKNKIQSEEAERLAREKINRRFGLLKHFLIYVVTNSFLFGFDHLVTTKGDWSYYPLFLWGIGLFIHALSVVFGDFLADWKEKEILKEIEKLIKK